MKPFHLKSKQWILIEKYSSPQKMISFFKRMKFITSLAFLLKFLHHLPSSSFGHTTLAPVDAKNASKKAQVHYDKNGVLTVHGSVPGTTESIVVDRRVNSFTLCAFRPTYTFTICPEDAVAMARKDKDCSQGIHFCYEGQLVKEKVREHFVLPRVSKEIADKCKEFTGFKIALHKLKRMFEFNKMDYLFMEVKTGYMDDSYYFPMPASRCLQLQMGNDSNILTSVRQKVNATSTRMVRPVRVRKQGNLREGIYYEGKDEKEMDKKFEEDFMSLPDSKKMERYENAAHLNMLYMDYRSGSFTPQMMIAIIPEKCNMKVQVRGNVIKACKADWKQKSMALRALAVNGSKTEYTLTIETGTEQWNVEGSKSKTSKSKTQGKEEGQGSINEETSLSGLQKSNEHIQRDSDEHTESTSKGESSSKGVKAFASGKAQGGEGRLTAEGTVEAGVQGDTSSSQTDTTSKFSARETSRGTSETTVTSTASIMENSFKSTESSMDTQNKQTYKSETTAITRKTVFRWKVKVPPGKVLVPMQMNMDCDGGEVKIPWMRFDIKDNYDDIPTPGVDYEDKSKDDGPKHDLDGKIL